MLRAIINAVLSYRARAWVVTDATGERYRTLEAYGPVWTDDLGRALWFARRQDADLFAADDEDAWGVVAVWNVFYVIPQTLAPRMSDPSYARMWNGLRLFRDFVNLNCTQWQMGAGTSGHPIWAHVANLLGRTHDPEGAEYRFIYPTNRLPLEELNQQELEAWSDDSEIYLTSTGDQPPTPRS